MLIENFKKMYDIGMKEITGFSHGEDKRVGKIKNY